MASPSKERSDASTGPHSFEDVDLTSLDSGRQRFWLRPAAGLCLIALVIGGGMDTIHNDLDSITLAGTEIGALDWMYGLSLLFVALVVVPPVVAAPERARRTLGRLRSRPLVAVAGCCLLVLVVVGTIYPSIAPEPRVRPLVSLQPPFWGEVSDVYVPTCHGPVVDGQCQGTFAYPLGTNGSGESLLNVSLRGLNTSLQVAVTAAVLAVTAGVVAGTVAGYVGGWLDELLMRYVDLQQSIPSFFVYVLLLLAVGRSYQLMILVFGLLSWGGIARLVRSEVTQLRTAPFVKSAELSGANTPFVVVRHIFPNASNTIVTAAALLFAKFVVYESSLAFLSLTDTSVISLGNQIASAVGRESADVTTPASGPLYDWGEVLWTVGVPVLILCSLLLVVSVLADGLRDVVDPRS